MNCIAIDDEPLALNVIQDFCSKIDFLDLKGVYFNALDAAAVISQQQIDLVFIDIQMPHFTGLDFVKTLKNPPLIIFTTAHSEYAVQGFEVNAVDYLIKPIPFNRFFQAVSKAYELHCLRNRSTAAKSGNSENTTISSYMLVKVEYATVRVEFSDIRYIEGIKDYVKIKKKGNQLLTKCTMKTLEDRLPSDDFVRVHKSYIISLSQIDKIENNRIIMGDKHIPIGNSYKGLFNSFLSKYRL